MRGVGVSGGAGVLAVTLAVLALAGCGGGPVAAISPSPDSTTDAYRNSVAALMWPGATRAYQVTASGDLFNGAWFVRIEAACDGANAGAPRRIAFEDRWCPVAHWTRRSGDVRWDFEAVAFPEPEPPFWSPRGALARYAAARAREADARSEAAIYANIPTQRLTHLVLRVRRPLERSAVDRRNLFVALRATMTNTGAAPVHARLALRCEPPGADRPWWDPDSLVHTPWAHCWQSEAPGDSLLGRADGNADGRTLSREWSIAPGGRADFDAVLPAYPTSSALLASLARVPHPIRADEARRYWRRETARGAAFDVPENDVCDAVRAARVLLLAARERRDVDWVPLGGPFHYRDVWVRDGARIAEALAVSGYTREGRELAMGLARFQTPLGTFVSQTGQLDGTGQVLWAFEQTMTRPSPAPALRKIAPDAVLAWRGIEGERALAGNAGAFAGMLPATNPHDAELVDAQLVGNDAWALVGYRSAARLLRAAGEPVEAGPIERSRADYLAAFDRALACTGRADVPPSWQGVGIDWGNLNVGYPCEVLPADDPRLAALARRYWAPVGGPGLGWYGNPDSLHTYVAADLGTVAMLAGDRAAADRILDAVLHWRTASGGAAECFAGSTREFGRNFPPHATAAAALISLVRNALVFDDADTLALALGARTRWWSGTSVRRAPTRWGLLDLRFARVADVAIWRWSAMPVWTLLTLPPGTRAAGVPAPLRPASRPDQVLAPPGTTSASIALTPETGS